MAIELKQGEILQDPRDKNETIEKPYGVVTQVNINHSRKMGRILIEVYPRPCNRAERCDQTVLPVLSYGEPVTAELYDEFFDKEVFSDGWNPQKAGYEMFSSLEEGEKYNIWQSDEE